MLKQFVFKNLAEGQFLSSRVTRPIRLSLAMFVISTTLVVWPNLGGDDRVAQAAQPRVIICHRTKSTSNPYRRITIPVNAYNSQKANHTGAVWTSGNSNGDTWGDIIPGDDSDANAFWTNATGSSKTGLNWTAGKSFMVAGGANISKCPTMSALRFYEVMKAAGQTDAQIAADLNDQEANEDLSINGGSATYFTAANVATSVGTISIRTNAPTAIGATTATLSGSIEAGSKSTVPYFEYGTSSSLGTTVSGGAAATGTIAATASLTGLATSTTYYYRVIGIINEGSDTQGTYYGDILSFTTGKTLRTVTMAVEGDTDGAASVNISSTAALSTSVSAGSPGSTTYNLLSGSLSCSISGSTLTTTSTSGTCKIEAIDAGDSTYSSSASSVVTVSVVQTYSVTYDGNSPSSGSVPSDSSSYASGATVTVLGNTGTLAKTGYSFDGWCTTQPAAGAACGGTSRAAASTFTISANTTLYAVWAAASQSISYDNNGGSGSISDTTGNTGASVTLSSGAAFTRSGRTLSSWNTASGGGGTTYALGSTLTMPAGGLTLYAVWTSSGGGGTTTTTTTTVAAATTTTTTRPPRRISICHATGSASNPYVQITVDAEGLNGHGDHADDIIPAPAGGCSARVVARAQAATTTTRVPRRISICHATGSETNPYVEITVDVEGLNGHGDHAGDIIPAPLGGCSLNAVNSQRVTTTTAPRRISICHATGSETNPYVEITVDANGLNGHGAHDDDISPAPADGCGQRAIRQAQSVTSSTAPRRITICHATGSETNPYVEITVDANSLSGHGDHPGDIIPAPAGGCNINNVLRTIVTTTTLPAGSLGRTQQQVNDVRNGGQNQIVANNLEITGTPTPAPRGGGGGGRGTGGGTVTLQPRLNAPSPQLLNVRASDPRIRVTVRSSGANYNQPSTWANEGFGSYCWKIEPFADSDYTYVLPNPSAPPDPDYAGLPYSSVIVKAGSVVESDPAYQANTVFMNPAAGSTVFADVNKNGISDPGGQGGGLLGDKSISHIVLCVGDSEFPDVAVTTTTIAGSGGGGGATTTSSTTSTTVAGGSSSTTTTVPGGSTTTTAPGATTTTTTTVTTIAPGATSPTTTSPGATPTTLPQGTPPSAPPPMEIVVSAPPGVTMPPRLELELFLTTGTANERLVLTVYTENFEVPPPYSAPPLLDLPETGVVRWTDRQMYGFGFITLGFGLLMFSATRRLRRR